MNPEESEARFSAIEKRLAFIESLIPKEAKPIAGNMADAPAARPAPAAERWR